MKRGCSLVCMQISLMEELLAKAGCVVGGRSLFTGLSQFSGVTCSTTCRLLEERRGLFRGNSAASNANGVGQLGKSYRCLAKVQSFFSRSVNGSPSFMRALTLGTKGLYIKWVLRAPQPSYSISVLTQIRPRVSAH